MFDPKTLRSPKHKLSRRFFMESLALLVGGVIGAVSAQRMGESVTAGALGTAAFGLLSVWFVRQVYASWQRGHEQALAAYAQLTGSANRTKRRVAGLWSGICFGERNGKVASHSY